MPALLLRGNWNAMHCREEQFCLSRNYSNCKKAIRLMNEDKVGEKRKNEK